MKEKIPKPDIAICSNCGGRFPVGDCPTRMESEGWEYPEYEVDDCPVCEDGGLIEDYDWSNPTTPPQGGKE